MGFFVVVNKTVIKKIITESIIKIFSYEKLLQRKQKKFMK
jgi:hypothetical protein